MPHSFIVDDGSLRGVNIKARDGASHALNADQLLVFFGLHPKLGPIAEWGLELEKKALKVDTEKFQTNLPGVFAVGDINTYPGKKKLILSGFHEAALAAFAIQHHLYPAEETVPAVHDHEPDHAPEAFRLGAASGSANKGFPRAMLASPMIQSRCHNLP